MDSKLSKVMLNFAGSTLSVVESPYDHASPVDLATIPKMQDPSWPERTRPLCEFLQTPKKMEEILSWGKSLGFNHTMTKNMIAYLSFYQVIRYIDGLDIWTMTT